MSLRRYKRVIFHCGVHKTGSSYIQQLLSKATTCLHNRSIHYPRFISGEDGVHGGNHSVVALHYRHGDDVERHFARFLELESDCSTLLISGEEFSRIHPIEEFLERLVVSVAGARLQFVFYLRRPDDLIESVYAESVKNRLYGDITKAAYQLNFLTTLQPFLDAVGRQSIIVRPYNRKRWPDGELGADFCAAIGVPKLWRELSAYQETGVNASLSRSEIFLLSRVRSRKIKLALLRHYSRVPLRASSDACKSFRSPAERRRINSNYRPHLQRLVDVFELGDVDEFFDLASYDDEAAWTPFRPDWEGLLDYLAEFLEQVVNGPGQK